MCLYDFALVPDWLSVCECVHLVKVVRVHGIRSEFRMPVCVNGVIVCKLNTNQKNVVCVPYIYFCVSIPASFDKD